MKAKIFSLASLESLEKAKEFFDEIIPDGKIKVTFSDAGSKSAKQRGLQWMGYEDKARSGKGGRLGDTKENCHLEAKYRFAVPIFLRDDPFFTDLYAGWCKKCELLEDKQERMLYFVDQHVSTEKFTTSQMAEFLTEFRNDCIRRGIELREPEFEGLLS
ncbi:hypothetical protein KAR91_77315 [Candidatus Pacearchaeota archaeon]|nr:hypothetical protein [Candidatus Pacearchaeota archaeon]